MTVGVGLEAACGAARAAIDWIERFGLAPDATNYTVLYAHCRGDRPALSAALAALIAQDTVTDGALATLFDRFFAGEAAAESVNETARRIEGVIAGAMSGLAEAGETSDGYGRSLADFSGRIAESRSPQDIQALIVGILHQTRTILQSNRALSQRLAQSSHEIAALRGRLDVVQREAETDPLTGLANRLLFDRGLAQALESVRGGAPSFAFLMLDIDHFKRFNDTFGHRIGDEVLKAVARVLRARLKGTDLPARIGGEEFCVLLPETPLAGALTLAEQIRADLAGKRLTNRASGADYGSVTLSIGAAVHRPGEDAAALIERADCALYRAKREGRNRVCAEAPLALAS